MSKLAPFIAAVVLILLLALAVLVAWNSANQPNGYEQAAIISAQGQARLDTLTGLAAIVGVIAAGAIGLAAIIGVLVVAGMFIYGGIAITTATITAVVTVAQINAQAARQQLAPPAVEVVYLPRPELQPVLRLPEPVKIIEYQR